MIFFHIASLLMIGAFLLLTLIVGLYFSKKKISFREYAVGNKNFPTPTLVATVLATDYGGGMLLRNVEQVHSRGMYWVILVLSTSFLSYWIISRLAARMGPFMQNLSMADTIGQVYGKYPRALAATSVVLAAIPGLALQITVMSKAIAICAGSIDPKKLTILSASILIFYSMYGGIRAVTFTDVLQFVTFAIIIPVFCWFMFVNTNKQIGEIIPYLQNQPKFQLHNLLQFDTTLLANISLFLCVLVSYVEPAKIQRIYMSSGPFQAKTVFFYGGIFSCCIMVLITLIGLFVFVASPSLPKEEIWGYILNTLPLLFQGFIAISLLAMAMSSADSDLNACSIMVSHDIFQSLAKLKPVSPTYSLRLARLTTLFVGLSGMLLTFYFNDLLELLKLGFAFSVPILTAPFILSIFGFRGTSRTSLIGMATGVLTILVWDKWIEPSTGIDGSFVAMLANGLAMLAAHYLLKQPESAGWVGPDTDFQQIQQEKARRSAERKEAIKNGWANRKATLAKLKPSHTTIVSIGFYLAITSLATHFIAPISSNGSWLIVQLCVSAFFVGYPFIYAISKTLRGIPTGLGWLIGLVVYFPLNLLWNWSHSVDPIFTLSLSLTHFALILWTLPLDLAITVIVVTGLVAIYPISIGFSYPLLCSLLPLLLGGLFLFAIIICLKVQQGSYISQLIYLKNQEEIRSSQQLKASLYNAALVPSNRDAFPKGYGSILEQVVRKVEESISFLDKDTPLFKEDFQSIINKFYDWVTYFNRREKAKEHALLQPTYITLDKLIRKVEVALSQEVNQPPRLLVERSHSPNLALSSYNIVCDINQVVYLLVKAVLRVGRLEGPHAPIVRIQPHSTLLRFKKADSIDNSSPISMHFQATALVISQSTTPSETLVKVKTCYDELDYIDLQRTKNVPPSIDLEQDTIASMVRAHYGHFELSAAKQLPSILLVLPTDVTDIRDKMTVKLPIDCLTSGLPVTPKEEADSMMALMKFHDHICKFVCKEDPIDIKTISGLLLLLRQHFYFKRHASGQLFYVRAVGISEIVVDWVFHAPKVIYASLLYELVRHTCLPLSYIKKHYNLGVYAFVSNVLKIDKRKELDDPSLLYVQNRLEKAIKEDHVQLSVLFIKLAERLYDLRHAAGYIHLTEVQHMAQETLAIDVQIANQYLGPEVGSLLEEAAKDALKLCKNTSTRKA